MTEVGADAATEAKLRIGLSRTRDNHAKRRTVRIPLKTTNLSKETEAAVVEEVSAANAVVVPKINMNLARTVLITNKLIEVLITPAAVSAVTTVAVLKPFKVAAVAVTTKKVVAVATTTKGVTLPRQTNLKTRIPQKPSASASPRNTLKSARRPSRRPSA